MKIQLKHKSRRDTNIFTFLLFSIFTISGLALNVFYGVYLTLPKLAASITLYLNVLCLQIGFSLNRNFAQILESLCWTCQKAILNLGMLFTFTLTFKFDKVVNN
jgi:hypothetical protein